jgi:hypothetical protein
MEDKKPWFKSKAVIAGVIAIFLAAYDTASMQFGLAPVPDFVYAVLGALGIYGRMSATTVIGGK